MKCSDCWYFEQSRFGDWHICTVDEDIEEDEPVYTVEPDDEACHRFELNLTKDDANDPERV